MNVDQTAWNVKIMNVSFVLKELSGLVSSA